MVAGLAAEEHIPRRMTLEAWADLWAELDELSPDDGEGDVEK